MCDDRNSKIRLYFESETSQIDINVNPNIFSMNNFTDIKYNVESLCVPKTYYNFTESVQVSFTDSTSATSLINFSPGNYTVNQFFDELISRMNFIEPFLIFSWSQVLITDKIEIVGAGVGIYNLEFLDAQTARYVGAIFGKNYLSDGFGVVSFENIPNFERTNNFILTTNLRNLNSTSYDNVESTDLENKNNFLTVLPAFFQSSNISDLSYHRSYYGNYGSFNQSGPTFTNPIRIDLRDDNLELIDLNGSKWTITLFLECNF